MSATRDRKLHQEQEGWGRPTQPGGVQGSRKETFPEDGVPNYQERARAEEAWRCQD